ncbi:hypothetical protein NDA10_005201 [Ustilago hordei]|nr:hypothetical protein NDA10_005201 [Ustilago hordei]
MVSDFFYPNVGGVEGHVYFLGGRLLSMGHKVIVITHAYAPIVWEQGEHNTSCQSRPQESLGDPKCGGCESVLPDQVGLSKGRLTVVVLSRLMYRKGIDLLIAAIPRLCAAHRTFTFSLAAMVETVELEQMRERYLLQDRVELCGAVRQGEVRDHLTRGSIFLNTSLTEAFGTCIIEAACAGLFVVSTRVGGVPEVLPPSMIRLAKPEEDDVVEPWTMLSPTFELASMIHLPITMPPEDVLVDRCSESARTSVPAGDGK